MGGDEVLEVGAEAADPGLAIEGLAHAEAGDDDVGFVVGESGFFGRESGWSVAGGEDVAGPAEIADREIGALAEEGFEVAMNAQLIGKGVADDCDAVSGSNGRFPEGAGDEE